MAKPSLEDVKRQYEMLESLLGVVRVVALTREELAQADRRVLRFASSDEEDLLDSLVAPWQHARQAGRFSLLTEQQIAGLDAVAAAVEQASKVWFPDHLDHPLWQQARAAAKRVLQENEWTDPLDAEEFELLHYWAELPKDE